jgi:hypothetical protein
MINCACSNTVDTAELAPQLRAALRRTQWDGRAEAHTRDHPLPPTLALGAGAGEPPQNIPIKGDVSGIEARHYDPSAELREQAETGPKICNVMKCFVVYPCYDCLICIRDLSVISWYAAQ